MPIKQNPGETQDEFISRCISEEVGKGHEQQQAIAICYSYVNMKKENRDKITGFANVNFMDLYQNKIK